MPLADTEDTELRRKAAEQPLWAPLYDPPVNGATPLDGEGNPQQSQIHLPDRAAKLAQGFTEEPVVAEPEKPARKKAE